MDKVIDIDSMTEDEIYEYMKKIFNDLMDGIISYEDYLNEHTKCKKKLEIPPKYDKHHWRDDAAVLSTYR